MIESEYSNRVRIIGILDGAEGESVSGAAIAEELGISRQAVFKAVASLRDEGVEIASSPQRGYSLSEPPLRTYALSPSWLDYLMRDSDFYVRCVYFEEADSTQSIIKKLAVQGAPEGVVAFADFQSAGRGRRGRVWNAPRGKNLSFSVLLRPKLKPGDVQLLNLAAGVAVRLALESFCDGKIELKWPNDILINGKKVCGILSEAAGEPDRIYHAVTGIGLNVNMEEADMPEDIRGRATSLLIENGKAVPRTELLAEILRQFEHLAASVQINGGRDNLLMLYRENCATIGKEVRVIQDEREIIGIASGVTNEGALTVKTPSGERVFAAADVFHLRMS